MVPTAYVGAHVCSLQKRLLFQPVPATVAGREVRGGNKKGRNESNGTENPEGKCRTTPFQATRVPVLLQTSAPWVRCGDASWEVGPREGRGRAPAECTRSFLGPAGL